MVLTKDELIASLQNEVRILLHLADKVDPAKLDYRPTAKQRSTIELLRYLSMSGPLMVRFARGEAVPADEWQAQAKAAETRNLEQVKTAIAAQSDAYAKLLSGMTDTDFRADMKSFDWSSTNRGSFLVNNVLGNAIAYRTQLFLYLKASGREELNTSNLWRGVDATPAAV